MLPICFGLHSINIIHYSCSCVQTVCNVNFLIRTVLFQESTNNLPILIVTTYGIQMTVIDSKI